MNKLRAWHSYIGAFMAPAIFFFALSGAFQLFDLHENHGHYRVPVLLEKLGQIHKDQAFSHAPPATVPATAPATVAAHDNDALAYTPARLALKVFFLIISISLMVSTLMGLWIGLSNARRKKILWALFVTGILLPLLLVVI